MNKPTEPTLTPVLSNPHFLFVAYNEKDVTGFSDRYNQVYFNLLTPT